MLNKKGKERMLFSEKIARVNVGDTVFWKAKSKGHNVEFIMKNDMDFWRGNIIKYASRAGHKIYDGMDAIGSEIADLHKVMRYAEMRINHINGRDVV